MELALPGCFVPANQQDAARNNTPSRGVASDGPKGSASFTSSARLSQSTAAHPFAPDDPIFDSREAKRPKAVPGSRAGERKRQLEKKRQREESAMGLAASSSSDPILTQAAPTSESRVGERQRQADSKRRRLEQAEADRAAAAVRAAAAECTPAARIMARIRANVVAKCIGKQLPHA